MKLIKCISALLFALVAVAGTAIVVFGKDSAGSRETRYQILSRGFQVGDLKTSMQPMVRDGRRLISFRSHTNISAGFFFFSHQSSTREEALISERGTEEYRCSGTDNGIDREVTARFSDRQVELTVREARAVKSLVFPRKSFDFTTMDCPEMSILAREGDRGEVRLLDLDGVRIVSRKYQWVRTELVKVGDRSILCRVIDFEDSDNRCRRWIFRDDRGIIIARQEGKGKSGSYQLKLTGLVEDKAT